MDTDLVSHDEHVDDPGCSVAPVDKPVALVAQRRGEVSRAELLVADIVDAGPQQLHLQVSLELGGGLRKTTTTRLYDDSTGHKAITLCGGCCMLLAVSVGQTLREAMILLSCCQFRNTNVQQLC